MKAIRIHEYGGPDILKYEDANRVATPSVQVSIRLSFKPTSCVGKCRVE